MFRRSDTWNTVALSAKGADVKRIERCPRGHKTIKMPTLFLCTFYVVQRGLALGVLLPAAGESTARRTASNQISNVVSHVLSWFSNLPVFFFSPHSLLAFLHIFFFWKKKSRPSTTPSLVILEIESKLKSKQYNVLLWWGSF